MEMKSCAINVCLFKVGSRACCREVKVPFQYGWVKRSDHFLGEVSMIAFKRHPHLSMQLSEAGTSVLFCGQRRNSKKPLWFAVICALTFAHWGEWLGMIHRNTPLKCHKHRDLLWHHQDYLTLLIGSDDLTLSKRAPSLTIARLQEFFSSDCDLLFANSRFWSSFCQFNLQKFFS